MSSPDRYVFDLHTPHPNVDIDTMRRAVLQAIADLDDSFYLADTLFVLLDGTLAELTAATAERQQLRADLDALTARVAALEPPPADPPLEVP